MSGVLRVVGGLFGIALWFICTGLQRVWQRTFGWLFSTLAGLIRHIGFDHFGIHFHPFGHAADWLESLSHNGFVLLGRLALDGEQLASWLFSRLRYVYHRLGTELHGLAADTLGFAQRLVTVYLPRLFTKLWHRLEHGLARTWKYIRATLPGILRLLKKYGRAIAHQAARELHRWAKNLHAFAWIERKLLKFIRSAAKRLLALERHFVPKRLRKWLAAIFPLFGIAWLLSHSWTRIGKEIVKWSWNMVGDFIYYFGRLEKHVSMTEAYKEADKLTKDLVAEYRFLMSLDDPPREAPAPLHPKPPV